MAIHSGAWSKQDLFFLEGLATARVVIRRSCQFPAQRRARCAEESERLGAHRETGPEASQTYFCVAVAERNKLVMPPPAPSAKASPLKPAS
jgi:hypothetical protein